VCVKIYTKIVAVAFVSLAAFLVACGDQGSGAADVPASVSTAAGVATPTTPPPAASATTLPVSTATAISSGAPSSTAEPTSPAALPTATPLATDPSETAAMSGVTITFTADSAARYRINEQLARLSLPTEAVGETGDITGAVVISADGVVERDSSVITIGLASLRSDEGRRDGYVRDRTLRTSEFPDATVAVSELRGLPWPLPSTGEVSVILVTDTTIRGVTSPLEWEAVITFDGDEVSGVAQASFPFATFNLSRPRLAFILSVEDNIRLELDFVATITAEE
jgi:polyisoprenoid-binding protein YceI